MKLKLRKAAAAAEGAVEGLAEFAEYLPSLQEFPSSGPSSPLNQEWWYTPVITALQRRRQEDPEFQVIFSYLVSSRPALDT